MSLQSITQLNVDFYNKKHILINAKQYDKKSRFILVTCYNHGELFPISFGEHSAYIRCRKPDGYGVFNFCKITEDGKVLIELTEQMLSSGGICYADLVIVNRGSARVDDETGEIIVIDNASILSTMTFCIDVSETAIENSHIESSYEFDGLNTALQKAEAEYTEVIQLSKSYAIGNAGGIRESEDADNAKYYYEQSLNNANNASKSEANALASEQKAKTSETNASKSEANAKAYMNNAYTYMGKTEGYMNDAKDSKNASATSEANAKTSENNAATSEQNAKASEEAAKTSETNAANSETNAATSEANALSSAGNANSYMEQTAEYMEVVKSVVNGLNSGFIPIGTITFAELATAEKATGFTYNISDDFITDETFAEGAGKSYTAGVNVYCRSDGLWDCFGGAASPTATVDEIKSYLGI